MSDELATLEASMLASEKKLVATVDECSRNLKLAQNELRKLRKSLRALRDGDKLHVKKHDFLEAAIGLLIDNNGQLAMDDLISLTKLHLREDGYSLSGVDLHIPKYLKDAHQLHLATDGTVSLKQPEQSSDV